MVNLDLVVGFSVYETTVCSFEMQNELYQL